MFRCKNHLIKAIVGHYSWCFTPGIADGVEPTVMPVAYVGSLWDSNHPQSREVYSIGQWVSHISPTVHVSSILFRYTHYQPF